MSLLFTSRIFRWKACVKKNFLHLCIAVTLSQILATNYTERPPISKPTCEFLEKYKKVIEV